MAQIADTHWAFLASGNRVLGVPLAAAYVNGPSAEFDDYADEWI